MFSPVPMTRLSAVILERDERNVLRMLGELGVIELTRSSVDTGSMSLAARDCREQRGRCHRLGARARELRKTLELSDAADAIPSPIEWSPARAEEKLTLMEKEANGFLQRRRALIERLDELKKVDGEMADYRGWQVPLDQPDESAFLHFVTGTLPPANLAKLQGELGSRVALVPLAERAGRQPLMLMTPRQNRGSVEKILQQAGFEKSVLPAFRGATVDSLTEDNRQEREKLEMKLLVANADLRAFAERCDRSLAEMEWGAENERRLLEARENGACTQTAVIFSGWVPRTDAEELNRRLEQITGGRCVVEIKEPPAVSEDSVPILLKHPRWLRPFEMLVTAYGLPLYRELEPTLVVAISYVLMFGVMFGDIGHGLILALAGLATIWRSQEVKVRDIGLLLFIAGSSSMFFGFLYGSVFGIPEFKQFALWHDPLEGDPMSLMVGSIIVGVIMISLGLVTNIINRCRQGDFLGGLFGKFGVAGALFYWGGLLFLTQHAAIESHGLTVPAVMLFLVLPVVGWVLKEPLEILIGRRAGKSIEPGGGLFALVCEATVGGFEAMLSFFANTISFVRLAAYALSHAALLMAAFLMADAVKHVSPAGGVLSVLIVILGNAVAILLEGVVASVQALRLEYYEFFGKFFSGEGRPFKPFRLQTTTVADAPL